MSKRRPYPEAVQAEVTAANREGREVELADQQLAELGHGKQPLTKVIRAFCLSCMGDNRAEVRRCTSPRCALFPYRLGKNPYTGRKGRPGFAEPADREPIQNERADLSAQTMNPPSDKPLSRSDLETDTPSAAPPTGCVPISNERNH